MLIIASLVIRSIISHLPTYRDRTYHIEGQVQFPVTTLIEEIMHTTSHTILRETHLVEEVIEISIPILPLHLHVSEVHQDDKPLLLTRHGIDDIAPGPGHYPAASGLLAKRQTLLLRLHELMPTCLQHSLLFTDKMSTGKLHESLPLSILIEMHTLIATQHNFLHASILEFDGTLHSFGRHSHSHHCCHPYSQSHPFSHLNTILRVEPLGYCTT